MNYKKMNFLATGITVLSAIVLSSCAQKIEQKIFVPDGLGGRMLTPLGRFVYGPWQLHFDRRNIKMLDDGKEIASYAQFYTSIEKYLLFHLTLDGDVEYWFKTDYDSAFADALKPGVKGETREVEPRNGKIEKIYKGGKWTFNSSDSSLSIDFGRNDFGLLILAGKYMTLTSSSFSLAQSSSYDSTGFSRPLHRIATTTFTHPYIYRKLNDE